MSYLNPNAMYAVVILSNRTSNPVEDQVGVWHDNKWHVIQVAGKVAARMRESGQFGKRVVVKSDDGLYVWSRDV